MTLNDLISLAGEHAWLVVLAFAVPPTAAFVVSATHEQGGGEKPPRSYVYAVLVYLACMPGLFALTLCGYSVFFLRTNLLDADLLVYALPIVSMVFTLAIIARKVRFEALPGFDRLSGLIILLTVTFVVLFLLARTRVWLFFGGSFLWLLALGVAIFLLLRFGASLALGTRRDD